jgi:hypothetical protein
MFAIWAGAVGQKIHQSYRERNYFAVLTRHILASESGFPAAIVRIIEARKPLPPLSHEVSKDAELLEGSWEEI